MKRLFKYLSFGTLGVILPMLVFATVLEKLHGTPFVSEHFYHSPWMIALWIILAISGSVFALLCNIHRNKATMALHISFLLILSGAFVTHLFGERGLLRLSLDTPPTTVFMLSDGSMGRLPFQISLNKFHLEYYPGTSAPMDYVSSITITDDKGSRNDTISMNNICSYAGYRLYQSGYDADMRSVTLQVAHDPYGIAITYTGYALLLASMIAYLFAKDGRFRRLLRSPLLKRGTAATMLLLCSSFAFAGKPGTLPRDAAAEFGNLYVCYNRRICPLQTIARDVTVKLYGKSHYKGFTAEQVLAGFCFFSDDWKEEAVIRIKETEIARLLGISEEYTSYNALATPGNKEKLQEALRSNNNALRRAAQNIDEKYNIIKMLCGGNLLRLHPYRGLNHVAKAVKAHDYDEATAELRRVIAFQRTTGGKDLPSDCRFTAEKIYNSHNYVHIMAMLCIAIGIIAYALYCRRMVLAESDKKNPLHKPLLVVLTLVFVYLTLFITLRGYIGGHLPLSNGFETMVFLAWSTALFGIFAGRRFPIAASFGFLLCGLSLMVATIGESNPQITLLMPVLQSPLLSLHVAAIMIAYTLFAFAMLNGVTALVLWRIKRDYRHVEYLATVSKIILFPAVFLLTAGIFIGAVWANISWGRYWGWDPKEVWALITMLVYSLALHDSVLSLLRRPLSFHIFCIAAFATVLITYFGVNFVLGGIHSYA